MKQKSLRKIRNRSLKSPKDLIHSGITSDSVRNNFCSNHNICSEAWLRLKTGATFITHHVDAPGQRDRSVGVSGEVMVKLRKEIRHLKPFTKLWRWWNHVFFAYLQLWLCICIYVQVVCLVITPHSVNVCLQIRFLCQDRESPLFLRLLLG